MVTYDVLFQTCVKYTARDYFVGDVIPEKKLVNARKRYPIPDQERVVALYDTTAFGSAKSGLAIGETGLHWRNTSVETNRAYMSWHELASAPITVKGFMPPRIELGKGVAIELATGGLGKHDLLKLLTDLQHLARSPTANKPPPITSTRELWMLALGGRQYGPYDLPTIQAMLAERQVNPRECWAWKEGMSEWVQFTQVPTLAALLRDTSRPPTMPPPLPPSAPSAPAGSPTAESGSPGRPRPEVRPHSVSYEDLFQVCAKYSGGGYYVGEAITQKKLTNARSHLSIPETEQVVALLDTTLFGSSKNGLAFCVGGVYWRETLSDPKRVSYAELASVDIRPKNFMEVEIGEGNGFQPAGGLELDDMVRLLLEIQSLARSSAPASPVSAAPRVGEGVTGSSLRRVGQGDVERASSQVDLNHAPVDDLLALPGMTLTNGQRLIKERERRRGFNTVEEVGQFLVLKPHQVEHLRRRVSIEPYGGGRPSAGRVIDF